MHITTHEKWVARARLPPIPKRKASAKAPVQRLGAGMGLFFRSKNKRPGSAPRSAVEQTQQRVERIESAVNPSSSSSEVPDAATLAAQQQAALKA